MSLHERDKSLQSFRRFDVPFTQIVKCGVPERRYCDEPSQHAEEAQGTDAVYRLELKPTDETDREQQPEVKQAPKPALELSAG